MTTVRSTKRRQLNERVHDSAAALFPPRLDESSAFTPSRDRAPHLSSSRISDPPSIYEEKDTVNETRDQTVSVPYDNVKRPRDDDDDELVPATSKPEPVHSDDIIRVNDNSNIKDYVCFGMVRILRSRVESADESPQFEVGDVKIHGHTLTSLSTGLTPVAVDRGKLCVAAGIALDSGAEIGSLTRKRERMIIDRLKHHRYISLEGFCHKRPVLAHGPRRKTHVEFTVRLLINVYGPSRLFESVGAFFSECRIHLQDPLQCGRDVQYRNPHMLEDDERECLVIMTRSFGVPQKDEFFGLGDVFDQLSDTKHLPEASIPSVIRTPLHRHQRQALHFMQKKEQGYLISESNGECQSSHQESKLGGAQSSVVRGGLVADQMGLGKTLQMIALIASDLDRDEISAARVGRPRERWEKPKLTATLVVVPLSLLQTWNDQLNAHVKPSTLKWRVFHGPKRSLHVAEIRELDIVLTTYDVVVFEHQKSNSVDGERALFSVMWQRIVLDEAHYIRNLHSKRTSCICALDASTHWAVTGTPIQNRLVDLHPLLQFMRASPFDDPHIFEASIIRPWKVNLDASAVCRLKSLVQSVAIRRTKASVDLPPREDLIRRVIFDATERQYYDVLRSRIQRNTSDEPTDPKDDPVNILRWIDMLRGMCSFGRESSTGAPRSDVHGTSSSEFQTEEEQIDCLFGTTMFHHGDDLADPGSQTDLSNTLDTFLSPDFGMPRVSSEQRNRHRSSPASTEPVSDHSSPWVPEDTSEYELGRPVSSKIQALLTDLISHDGKSVVFSFWRATLRSIHETLTAASIPHLTLDGSKAIDERNAVIDTFRQNPTFKVLLATISAGGVGLDLTIANQVCLMEPQWNPTAEEQALSRVHRMNQKRAVTTIRYVVKESIEENILELQRRKMGLASLAFDGDRKSTARRLLNDLKLLL